MGRDKGRGHNDTGINKRGLTVKVHNNNLNKAMRELKKRLISEGIPKEVHLHEYFESNASKRRRALAQAKKRLRRQEAQSDPFPSTDSLGRSPRR
jgi:small subunit ribosomal protein S21